MSYLGQVGVLVVALVGGSFDSGCNDFALAVLTIVEYPSRDFLVLKGEREQRIGTASLMIRTESIIDENWKSIL
jgi:hypothetical protein